MGFSKRSTATQVTEGVDLSGKTALVTGCNSGIGKETVRVLAKRGAHVIGTARTLSKAADACDELSSETATGESIKRTITPLACELTDHGSIRAAATEIRNQFKNLDIVVCNAGIMALPKFESVNGFEQQFMTNHIGHFLLVNLLMDTIMASEAARVVCVSSAAHMQAPTGGIDFENLDHGKGYSAFRTYGRSKLANVLFANQLARQFKGTKHTANSLHPGIIATNLGRHMNPLIGLAFGLFGFWAMKNVAQGAATSCYLAANPDVEGVSGQYFSDSQLAKALSISKDEALAIRLWDESSKIVDRIASVQTPETASSSCVKRRISL
jgi:WW domain-containing oxidoreductase